MENKNVQDCTKINSKVHSFLLYFLRGGITKDEEKRRKFKQVKTGVINNENT